ncbi:response regulator [Geobacillus subterraneus]|uniref:response regulator n=1 Tax=Geobacillus subterraneus TaxID=129338 RepID=UPI00160B0758
MSNDIITVMIVEDDNTAATIYEQFTHKIEGFQVIASARNGQTALNLLDIYVPQLILLDIYLPDMNGIELLGEIRKKHHDTDVILITAANDVDTVKEAVRSGAFDYLIKPVMMNRFLSALKQYIFFRQKFYQNKFISQNEIDLLFSSSQPRRIKELDNDEKGRIEGLPKGIDKYTLKLIKEHIKGKTKSISADELAQLIGVSHSTTRRYLEYMVSNGELEVEVVYGSIGRPERRYKHRS